MDGEGPNRWPGNPTQFLAHRRDGSRGRTPAGRDFATDPRRHTSRSRWHPFGSVSLSNSYHTHTQSCSRSWDRSLHSYTGLRHIHPHPSHTCKVEKKNESCVVEQWRGHLIDGLILYVGEGPGYFLGSPSVWIWCKNLSLSISYHCPVKPGRQLQLFSPSEQFPPLKQL